MVATLSKDKKFNFETGTFLFYEEIIRKKEIFQGEKNMKRKVHPGTKAIKLTERGLSMGVVNSEMKISCTIGETPF